MGQVEGNLPGKTQPELDDFSKTVNKLPPNSQDLIAFLSSQFLEEDVYQKTRKDPSKIDRIAAMFKEQGVGENDIHTILEHLHLPLEKKSPFPKEKTNGIGNK